MLNKFLRDVHGHFVEYNQFYIIKLSGWPMKKLLMEIYSNNSEFQLIVLKLFLY